jgi:hypothetical protein
VLRLRNLLGIRLRYTLGQCGLYVSGSSVAADSIQVCDLSSLGLTESTALVALLSGSSSESTRSSHALGSRTIGLDMSYMSENIQDVELQLTDSSTGVALLAIGSSGLGAVGRLVSGFSAVVAQPSGSLACLGVMANCQSAG